jgi:hypothetical protein
MREIATATPDGHRLMIAQKFNPPAPKRSELSRPMHGLLRPASGFSPRAKKYEHRIASAASGRQSPWQLLARAVRSIVLTAQFFHSRTDRREIVGGSGSIHASSFIGLVRVSWPVNYLQPLAPAIVLLLAASACAPRVIFRWGGRSSQGDRRFADSPLEGDGFEPLLPHQIRSLFPRQPDAWAAPVLSAEV